MEKGKNYNCPHCERILQNPQALKMHIKWAHDGESQNQTQSIGENSKVVKSSTGEVSSLPSSDVSDVDKEELSFNDFYVPGQNNSSPDVAQGSCSECGHSVNSSIKSCPNCKEVFE
jgi:hypothetical protein